MADTPSAHKAGMRSRHQACGELGVTQRAVVRFQPTNEIVAVPSHRHKPNQNKWPKPRLLV